MKRIVIGLSIIISFMINPVFANLPQQLFNNSDNDCVRYIDDKLFVPFLMLDSCRLHDKDIPSVLSYLSSHPEILYLSLDNNNIGPKGAKMLAQQLKVVSVFLDNNHIGSAGAIALAQNTSIYELSLRNNYISTAGALALAQKQNLPRIDLGNNNIAMDAIVALAKNPSLGYLGIANIALDAPTVATLAKNQTLIGLDLSYTNISRADLKTIINRPDLFWLAINGLHLGDKVTKSLSQRPDLVGLELADNDITAQGASALADLPNILIARWGHNDLSDDGVSNLLQKTRLKPGEGLIELELKDNHITDRGALTLANNPLFISYLDLSHNHIGQTGIDALLTSSYINILNIDYNDGLSASKASRFSDRGTKSKIAVIIARCPEKMRSLCLKHLLNRMI